MPGSRKGRDLTFDVGAVKGPAVHPHGMGPRYGQADARAAYGIGRGGGEGGGGDTPRSTSSVNFVLAKLRTTVLASREAPMIQPVCGGHRPGGYKQHETGKTQGCRGGSTGA